MVSHACDAASESSKDSGSAMVCRSDGTGPASRVLLVHRIDIATEPGRIDPGGVGECREEEHSGHEPVPYRPQLTDR